MRLPISNLVHDPLGFLLDLALIAPAVLIGLVFHEAAHALVAYLCGDKTAKYMGRLTLNPARHLDPLGLAMLALLGIGYAKPVPVNPANFKKPRLYDFFVSIAGIVTNLLLCVIFYTVFLWYVNFVGDNEIVYTMLYACASLNASLAVFNLIPMPPLDGYHILNDFILRRPLFADANAARIGQGILLALSFTGILGRALSYVTDGILEGIFFLFKQVVVHFI